MLLLGSCYRLFVQRKHWKYKSYRATCYVTNLYPETNTCKLWRSKTCQNTTFTWLEHARPSTKSRHIIGAHSRGSYAYNVTVNRYIGRITDTNPIMRRVTSLTCTLKRILVNYRAMQHAKTQPLHYSNSTKNVWQTCLHRRGMLCMHIYIYMMYDMTFVLCHVMSCHVMSCHVSCHVYAWQLA